MHIVHVHVYFISFSPDGMDIADTGNLNLLMPPAPGTPVLDETGSNQTFIDITWTPSAFSFSPVVYTLEVNLTHLDDSMEQRNATVRGGERERKRGRGRKREGEREEREKSREKRGS